MIILKENMKYKFPANIARIENYKIKELTLNKCKRNTKFQAASISKVVTAILVMKLVEEKKLQLNKNVNTYLKKWKLKNKKGELIKRTLKELLSHTAGINVDGFPGYSYKSKIPTINQILNGEKPCNTEKIYARYSKGKYRYSGGGYIIIQKIIEDVTGDKFENLVEKKIFKKLKMGNSNFGIKKSARFRIYPEKAAAGLWSTSEDLSKLLMEMQLSYIGKSNRILSGSSIKKILKPLIKAEGAFMGEGIFIDKHDFYHTGFNYKFRSKLKGSIKGGNGIVVMVNSNTLPNIK